MSIIMKRFYTPRALTRSFTETPCSSGGISGRRLSTRSGGGGLTLGPARTAPIPDLSLSDGLPSVGQAGGLPDGLPSVAKQADFLMVVQMTLL